MRYKKYLRSATINENLSWIIVENRIKLLQHVSEKNVHNLILCLYKNYQKQVSSKFFIVILTNESVK